MRLRILGSTLAAGIVLSAVGAANVLAQTSTTTTLPPLSVETAKKTKAPARKAAKTKAPATQSEPSADAAKSPEAGKAPPPYAGGQVATGGQLGILGDVSVMDSPFSQTSYTSKTAQDLQARNVGDVLISEPSVRSVQASGAGYGQNTYFIRGFFLSNSDLALNGLYGLAPYYLTPPNFVERIEVLKGPSALLNGMPPGGAVGGSVNLVTKQAPDAPVTQVTTTYQSEGLFGTQLDFARRFGTAKEFGIRFNGGYSAGETSIDGQHDELGNAMLNLDYRGERLRVSADVGYQSDSLSSVQRFLTMVSLPSAAIAPFPAIPPVPSAPSAGSNYGVPWSYWKPTDKLAMIQGELDVTEQLTVYGAYGWHDSRNSFAYPSPAVWNGLGDWTANPFKGADAYETWSGTAGVRAKVETGPVHHTLNVSYSSIHQDNALSTAAVTSTGNCPAFLLALVPASAVCGNIYTFGSTVPEPTFGPVLPVTQSSTSLTSAGVSDTLSVLDDRVQLTVGARRQTAGTESTDPASGAMLTSTEATVWSPAYGLVVKPLTNVSLYANYIEGLSVGTTVQPPYLNAGEVIPPFQTKQKEAGVKVDFGRLTTTLAAFEIERPSLVTVGGLSGSLKADGEQVNRGVELNVFGELTPDLRLLGGVAFIDGRLTKTTGGVNDGNRAQGVADVNVSIGAEWDTPFVPGLTLTGRVIYTSDVYADAGNTLSLPDWTRFDLGARYTFTSPLNGKPVTIRAAVENVANASYYAGSYSGDGIVTLGAPRTFLLSTTFDF